LRGPLSVRLKGRHRRGSAPMSIKHTNSNKSINVLYLNIYWMNIGALPRRCRPCSLTESYITPGQNTTPGRAGALFRLRIMRAGPKSWKFVEIGKDRGEFGIETLKGVL